MNSKNFKCLHWLNLEKPVLQFYGKSVFCKAKHKNTVILLIFILIIMTKFPESFAAQTKLEATTENLVEIISFDWFTGRDWKITNEFLNNNWKSFNFADGNRNFQSILEENRKFLANQKVGFIYELSIKNNSPQKISALSWEYVFKNPLNGEILGTHQFVCQQQIKPNESKNLFVYSDNPPTNLISIELLQRNSQKPYLESAAINSVTFFEMSASKTKTGF